jgi:hypothetical protein
VLWRYVHAMTVIGRMKGLTEDSIADLLGFSDAVALQHSFRRRSTQIPNRRDAKTLAAQRSSRGYK